MRFFCTNCNEKIETAPFWEGMTVSCPSCGETSTLEYREGQKIPNTEYSVSFTDFKQLVTYESYSETIHPLIQKHLRCTIKGVGNNTKLVAKDGSSIPLEVAHIEIQLDNSAQREIYNAAMSMWR